MEDMIDSCRSIIADSMISENAPIAKVILPSLESSQPHIASVGSQVILDATGNNLDLLIESRAHTTIEQNDFEIYGETPLISREILRHYPFLDYFRLSMIRTYDCDLAQHGLISHSPR